MKQPDNAENTGHTDGGDCATCVTSRLAPAGPNDSSATAKITTSSEMCQRGPRRKPLENQGLLASAGRLQRLGDVDVVPKTVPTFRLGQSGAGVAADVLVVSRDSCFAKRQAARGWSG